ncbi:MAG: polyprenol monophosphomannose synthase [Myxococcales bacterium]|nr:polyprenol monophosphomannose synthase [Myxococcales bacterium]
MERVLIIIPTYNERENLEAILAATQRELLGAPFAVDFLVVDDHSPDGTGEIADGLAARDPHIHVLHRAGKLGLGTAYLAGFRRAIADRYDYIFEMDADFSHDPKYLAPMIDLLRREADMVVGSRYVAGGGTVNWGAGRKLISRGGSLYARTILGIKVRDITAGFVGYRLATLLGIGLDTIRSNGYSFQIEMKYRAVRAGYRVVEHPIVFPDRRVGKSKMSRKIVLEALTMVWRMRLGLT